MWLMLISCLSPTTILRAEAMLFNSPAVPRTIRRCILRPSGAASRHLKHQTAGPAHVARPTHCHLAYPSPLCGTTETGDMLMGMLNPRGLRALERCFAAAMLFVKRHLFFHGNFPFADHPEESLERLELVPYASTGS